LSQYNTTGGNIESDDDKIGDINETLSMILPYSQTLALHGVK